MNVGDGLKALTSSKTAGPGVCQRGRRKPVACPAAAITITAAGRYTVCNNALLLISDTDSAGARFHLYHR